MSRLQKQLLTGLIAVLQLLALPATAAAGCALRVGGVESCCCAGHGSRADAPPAPRAVVAAHGCCAGEEAPAEPAAPAPERPCACVVAPQGDPATAPEAPAGPERPVLAPLAWVPAPVIASAGARRAVRAARGPLPGDRPPRWLVLQVVRR
jgi:hypothetical protein